MLMHFDRVSHRLHKGCHLLQTSQHPSSPFVGDVTSREEAKSHVGNCVGSLVVGLDVGFGDGVNVGDALQQPLRSASKICSHHTDAFCLSMIPITARLAG